MICGVGPRCGLDAALLWLWCTLATTVPIPPLAWKPPYAEGAVLKRPPPKKKPKKQKEVMYDKPGVKRRSVLGRRYSWCQDPKMGVNPDLLNERKSANYPGKVSGNQLTIRAQGRSQAWRWACLLWSQEVSCHSLGGSSWGRY